MNSYFVASLSQVPPVLKQNGAVFVTPSGEVFQYVKPSDTLSGIGGFFKSLGKVLLPVAGAAASFIPGVGPAAQKAISLIGNVGGGLLSQSGGGGGGGGAVATGLAGINAFGQQITQALNDVLAKLGSGQIPPADAVNAANQMVAALSDPAQVYQAKKGKDAAALAGFKTSATQKAAEIQALATTLPQNPASQAAIGSTGSINRNAGGGAAAGGLGAPGISNETLMLGGAILAAILLFKR